MKAINKTETRVQELLQSRRDTRAIFSFVIRGCRRLGCRSVEGQKDVHIVAGIENSTNGFFRKVTNLEFDMSENVQKMEHRWHSPCCSHPFVIGICCEQWHCGSRHKHTASWTRVSAA